MPTSFSSWRQGISNTQLNNNSKEESDLTSGFNSLHISSSKTPPEEERLKKEDLPAHYFEPELFEDSEETKFETNRDSYAAYNGPYHSGSHSKHRSRDSAIAFSNTGSLSPRASLESEVDIFDDVSEELEHDFYPEASAIKVSRLASPAISPTVTNNESADLSSEYWIEFSVGEKTPKHIQLLSQAYGLYLSFHRGADHHFFSSIQENITSLLATYKRLSSAAPSKDPDATRLYADCLRDCNSQIRSLTEHLILSSQKRDAQTRPVSRAQVSSDSHYGSSRKARFSSSRLDTDSLPSSPRSRCHSVRSSNQNHYRPSPYIQRHSHVPSTPTLPSWNVEHHGLRFPQGTRGSRASTPSEAFFYTPRGPQPSWYGENYHNRSSVSRLSSRSYHYPAQDDHSTHSLHDRWDPRQTYSRMQ